MPCFFLFLSDLSWCFFLNKLANFGISNFRQSHLMVLHVVPPPDESVGSMMALSWSCVNLQLLRWQGAVVVRPLRALIAVGPFIGLGLARRRRCGAMALCDAIVAE